MESPLKSAPPIFLHSALDEAGLSPRAFRVAGHLARRTGANGLAYPSVESMAEVVCMDSKTVKLALTELVARGIIARDSRPGFPSIYRLNPVEKYTAAPARKTGHPKTTPAQKTAQGVAQKTAQGVAQKTDHKGYPYKVIQQGNPDNALPAPALALLHSPEESGIIADAQTGAAARLYESYPRKKSKPQALKSISRALKRAPEETIVSGIRRWADYWKAEGTEDRFIPYPATWFNADTWNDPIPATEKNIGSGGRPAAATQPAVPKVFTNKWAEQLADFERMDSTPNQATA